MPLRGDYQQKNIKTVLTAIDQLRRQGIVISNSSVKNGLEKVVSNTGFAGRWSILQKTPLIIADTGHNQAGLEYNFNQLKELMQNRPGGTLRIVIGFVADKAIDKIMELLPSNAVYYVTNAQIPRALPAEKLIVIFK